MLDAGCGEGSLKLVEKRRPGVEYFVEHQHGNLLLLTNAQMQHTQGYSSNYRLFICPVGDLRLENWKVTSSTILCSCMCIDNFCIR